MLTAKERFEAAKARVESETSTIIADTPELAAEFGVPVGTTVLIRKPPILDLSNPQDMLDDLMYKEWVRSGGVE